MTPKIYKGVELGEGVEIGDGVIIGLPPKGHSDGELKTVIGDNAIIRSHTTIYAGNRIGNDFQTGHHVLIRELNEIGNDVSVGTSTVVEHNVKIKDGVRIHSQAFIPEFSLLEEGAWIGPNVVLTNATYPCSINVKQTLKGPILRKNCRIGANSTLLPGLEIGENSLIGAGSVVTKAVEADSVIAGNPAIKINTTNNLPYE